MTVLDTAAAALHYDVTERTIRRWVRDGRLTNHGTPKRVRVALLDKMSARVCSSRNLSPEPPRH